MIFRQLIDHTSYTYSYLIASDKGREALIIDPVKENIDQYINLINELNLRLVVAIDTHMHADHITALGSLQGQLNCATMMGEYTTAECVTARVREDEIITIDGIKLRALYTPGHTDEHFSFAMNDRVFTGDCLLIRGTGRTDFQNGDPYKSYDSIVNKLFKLPDDMLVYPAHDYKGWTVSTIGEEKKYNPRIAGKTVAEYVEIMNQLNLPFPHLMDVAIGANAKCGFEKGTVEHGL